MKWVASLLHIVRGAPFATPLDAATPARNRGDEMASRLSRRTRLRGSSAASVEKSTGSLVRFVLVVALLSWMFRTFFVQPFYIPSGSMLPTLYIGDYLIVAKWPYGYSRYSFPLDVPAFEGRIAAALPKRGDVVVFRNPVENADLIKRVIGLPGDTVEMRGGLLLLNNRPVERRHLPDATLTVSPNSPCRAAPESLRNMAIVNGRATCIYHAYLETLPGGPSYTVLDQVVNGPADNFPATRVPRGHLFVMGDNRDDSLDSRFPTADGGVGMLAEENLVGRALFTFWSTDGTASYLKPWTWFTALRGDRIGNGYTGASR